MNEKRDLSPTSSCYGTYAVNTKKDKNTLLFVPETIYKTSM